ncbi:MAG: peptide chain release factor N(5)-glutamine methyltransferase [Desulfobacteraceae bacterium]|nr:peptide chain release factor N(5)-glutamine methyltransferase [Desulfobacteraceae bacterium]
MIDRTIIESISWAESYLKDHGIDSPRLTAEIFLCFSLGLERLDLYLQHDRPLEKNEFARFKVLVKRRIEREPVAYITGEKGFFESDFQVQKGVLIPRPDTEVLVETAIDLLGALEDQSRAKNVLELGVGSGAIVVSLAKACPGHVYFGCDLSRIALETAIENASNLSQTPIRFFQGSWFDAVGPGESFDMILSNPPYIPTKDIEKLALEIKNHEPSLALDGGVGGLDSIANILDNARGRLVPGGRLLIEMGFDQRDAVLSLIRTFPEYETIEFIRDLAGHVRLVSIKKRN